MKIAVDARMAITPPTGIGRVAVNLLEGLARLDSRDEYVALSPDGDISQLSGLANIRQIRTGFGYLSPKAHVEMPRVLGKSGAELVNYLYFFTPIYSPVPSVATVFDTIYSYFPHLLSPQRRFMYKACMNHCIGQAAAIIYPSQSAMNDVQKFFPRSTKIKSHVVYLGVEERFHPQRPADEPAAKSALGLPESYLLYVGNHRGHKNLRRLIEAFSKIREQVPHSLVLPLAGKIGGEATLQAVDEFGVTDRVVFHPLPDDALPTIYSMADALVLPSLSEGFGLPPLEAMACGTPVIVSNVSSLPEVVGDAGVLIDPYDVGALAHSILKVLSDADLRKSMSERGVERAKLFTWEKTARQTAEVYRQVLGG